MLGRRIDGIQLDWLVAGVNEVVPCAGRNDERAILLNAGLKIQSVFLLAHFYNALTSFQAYELVKVGVDLQSDIFPGINAHQRKLQMLSRP